MSKIIKILSFSGMMLLLLLTAKTSLLSQSLVGGDLTYRCLGGEQYEVTLTIRKDCSEDGVAVFDNPAALGIFDIFGALILGLEDKGIAYMPLVSQTNVQDDVIFDCDMPLEALCVEEGIYRDTITLPYNKLGYIISYQRCCRNEEVLNIVDPGITGATYTSLLNYIALQECNSQPAFTSWPSVELCTDSELDFDHSAIDPDGDNLVYRICAPYAGASPSNVKPEPPANPPYEEIEWASGYGLNNIMGSNNNFSINPNTGRITAEGVELGTYLIGICVDEYRNGVLLSTVKRDFEITVTSCTDPLTAEFEVENIDCDGDHSISITNNSVGADNYLWYFDYPNTDPAFTSTDVNPVFEYPGPGTYVIRLESSRDSDGCTTATEQTIIIRSSEISADFDVEYDSCEGGENFILTDQSTVLPDSIEITNLDWIVVVEGDTMTYTGDSVNVTAAIGAMVSVELTVTASDGCTASIADDFLNTFGTDLIIVPGINDCEDVINMTYTDVSSELGGVDIVSQTWTIDGNVLSTGSSVNFDIDEDGVIIHYIVEYENGCTQEYNDFLEIEDVNPGVDVSAELIECSQDSATIIFTGITSDSIEILNEGWTINGQTYNMNPLTITLSTSEPVELVFEVDYANGCSNSISINSSVLPELGIENDQEGCPDVDSLGVTFTPVLTGGVVEVTPLDFTWTYDLGQGPMIFVGNELFLILSPNQPVDINLVLTLEEGCEMSAEDEFELIPMEDLAIDIDLNCDDPFNPIVVLTDTTNLPPGVTIVSQTWTIDGQTATGSTVEFVVDEDGVLVTLIVEYSNDCIEEYSNFFEPYLPIDVEIGINSIDTCTGEVDLYVIDADSSLLYEWALNNSFDDIIGTGENLVYEVPEFFDGYVYVQASLNDGERCSYGIDSLQVSDESINISFEDNFEICAGDTIIYEVTNNNPDHELVFEWKDENGFIISGGDTPSPEIGVPADQEDDFFLILCTSNQFGCTSVDTIQFDLGENDDLDPFTFELDSCGSLTINFMANNTFDGFPHRDFGDGNTSTELNPSNTYDSSGVYIVTLSDSSMICPQNEVMDTVIVPELIELEIAADTIMFVEGDTVTISATTNGDPSTIQWCDEDGNLIFTGNPIEYVPMDSCVVLTAKITDEYGCEDSDMVVLKEEEDCRDFEIDGPDVVCVGEEFELELITECDIDDYTYLWDPMECIISGGDTPNPTVSTEVSKTFSVLITSLSTGLDTVLTFDVEVSMPEITITTENGEDFICLGEEGTLLVTPFDPDCEYTWSTGETGNSILVMPEVNTTYTVTCIDQFGCEASDEFTLMVTQPTCNEEDIFVPTAFSPNGDNVNDVLYVRSKFVETLDFQIVNRWGEEMFRTNDINVGWDGTFNGEPLSPDVFAFRVEVGCINGDSYAVSGNVLLIK